jgi:membrane protein involved in colicin uptake
LTIIDQQFYFSSHVAGLETRQARGRAEAVQAAEAAVAAEHEASNDAAAAREKLAEAEAALEEAHGSAAAGTEAMAERTAALTSRLAELRAVVTGEPASREGGQGVDGTGNTAADKAGGAPDVTKQLEAAVESVARLLDEHVDGEQRRVQVGVRLSHSLRFPSSVRTAAYKTQYVLYILDG